MVELPAFNRRDAGSVPAGGTRILYCVVEKWSSHQAHNLGDRGFESHLRYYKNPKDRGNRLEDSGGCMFRWAKWFKPSPFQGEDCEFESRPEYNMAPPLPMRTGRTEGSFYA
jgi:hypothetical protein